MFTDTPTIIVFAVLLVGSPGLVQLWLWHKDRSLSALGIWGVADLTGALGLALLAARGLVPNRISVDLALAIISVDVGLLWFGARTFERRPVPVPAAAVGAAAWLAACQVPAFYAEQAYRMAGASLIIGTYLLLCAREFRRKRPGPDLPSRRALAVVFGADAAMQGLRIVSAVAFHLDRNSFSLPASPLLTVPAMIGVVLVAGTGILLISVVKEETEQRALAVLAQAKDTADRANLAKTRFLARMSHELRTPLNGVLGMAQALTADPAVRGVQRERALTLEQGGRHLLAIINDTLDLASVETGRLKLAPQPVRTKDLIGASIGLVAENARAKNIALTVERDAGLPEAMLADAVRVRQILLNLLGNAIKFTPAGGRVVLSVVRSGAPDGVRFEVADTGLGVPAEIRPVLFQDFAQRPLEMAATEGTGLGLAISASLAHAMGGTLRYRPGSNGTGSIFTADLPLPGVQSPESVPRRPARPPVSGLRILVVDDVSSNRRLAELLLQQAGHAVQVAADGPSALAALEQGPAPDVVLMDVFMPGMDGMETARRIRALDGPGAAVPIVALTADATEERARACLDAGMCGVVTKPIDVAALQAAIGRAVSPAR